MRESVCILVDVKRKPGIFTSSSFLSYPLVYVE